MNRTLKTTLIAATVLLGTTAGAFAATTAWADGKAKMREHPAKWADVIEVLHDGDKFKVFGCFESNGTKWCKGKHGGDVGYIRLSDLDFHNGGFEIDFDNGDVEFEFGSGGFEVEIEF